MHFKRVTNHPFGYFEGGRTTLFCLKSGSITLDLDFGVASLWQKKNRSGLAHQDLATMVIQFGSLGHPHRAEGLVATSLIIHTYIRRMRERKSFSDGPMVVD
jgi:hypothetical protein